jgi:hypothetical protein
MYFYKFIKVVCEKIDYKNKVFTGGNL